MSSKLPCSLGPQLDWPSAVHENFAVIGAGRSATKWFAWLLNQDDQWTVEHELNGDGGLESNVPEAKRRFARNRYGEVNSRLRRIFWRIPLKRRGVIIRRPRDILVSAVNWKPDRSLETISHKIAEACRIIDDCVLRGCVILRYDLLTTDALYAEMAAIWLGVCGLHVKDSHLNTPFNRIENKLQWMDLPPETREWFEGATDWFEKKYDL